MAYLETTKVFLPNSSYIVTLIPFGNSVYGNSTVAKSNIFGLTNTDFILPESVYLMLIESASPLGTKSAKLDF